MQMIDEAFEFYNIDKSYKGKCYKIAKEINENECYKKAFNKIYDILYHGDFSVIKELWKIKDINTLFMNNINPFVTNLMIILGYEIHQNSMNEYHFDVNQINIHKKRVRECFENDLINRGYDGVRISQMLWASYFIRGRIVEIGRLQYEYFNMDGNDCTFKIHIPKGSKLDIVSVKESIRVSKSVLEQIYRIQKIKYICDSWLLSNQIYAIVDKNSNISKFHDLFDVVDGENCIFDILNFVYETNICEDYVLLPESTSLQRSIKKQLLENKSFYLGKGILNLEYCEINR